MTGFAADWLALRAPADDAARDRDLLHAAAAMAGDGLIADIGGGTGATFHAVSPLAPGATWRVIDADAALLEALPDDPRLTGVQVDLAADPAAVFEGAPRLITGSAFFDLASRDWIEGFADLLAAHGAPLYSALTYDGREEWAPKPPGEDEALAVFHADMRRDKGLGPSLGAGAHEALASALRARGFEVREARSDWRLTRPDFSALIEELADGGARALADALPPEMIGPWRAGRRAATSVLVGHLDLLATPPS